MVRLCCLYNLRLGAPVLKRLATSVLLAALLTPLRSQASANQGASLEANFNSATAAMQAGRYPEAEQGLKAILAADPANIAALGNLGVLYSRTHRLAEAIAVDQRALAVDANDPSLLLNLGLAYLKQEAYRQARPIFERLDAAEPGNPRAALLLATCMVLGDAPQQGITLLTTRQLDTRDPSALYLEAAGYARLNQMDAARALFERLLANGDTRAQASFLLGQALHDGHRLEDAAASFNDILKVNPTFPGTHRELGKVYISMQHFPEAQRELRTAITEDPQDGSALYFLGALLIQTSHEAEGIPYLDRASTLMPDSWAIPFYLGKAALHQGHPEDAIPLLETAASRNADEPQIFYLLANAQRSSGHPGAAKAALARVAALQTSALDAEKQAMSGKVAGLH